MCVCVSWIYIYVYIMIWIYNICIYDMCLFQGSLKHIQTEYVFVWFVRGRLTTYIRGYPWLPFRRTNNTIFQNRAKRTQCQMQETTTIGCPVHLKFHCESCTYQMNMSYTEKAGCLNVDLHVVLLKKTMHKHGLSKSMFLQIKSCSCTRCVHTQLSPFKRLLG